MGSDRTRKTGIFPGNKQKDLARAAFDDDVAVLADSAGLLRESLGGSGVGLRLEVVLFAVSHGFFRFSLSLSSLSEL